MDGSAADAAYLNKSLELTPGIASGLIELVFLNGRRCIDSAA